MSSQVAWNAYSKATLVWPLIRSLSYQSFLVFTEARVSDEALARHGGDLFLACACGQRFEEALIAFDTGPLREAAQRMAWGTMLAEHEEILQRARIKLLVGPRPLITSYAGHGSLTAWVRTSLRRCAIDIYNENNRFGDEWESRTPAVADARPDWDLDRARFVRQLDTSLSQALRSLSGDERDLLGKHFLEELSVEHISRALGVHKSTAARRLLVLRERLRRETERLVSFQYGITTDEFRTLWETFGDRVDLSRLWARACRSQPAASAGI